MDRVTRWGLWLFCVVGCMHDSNNIIEHLAANTMESSAADGLKYASWKGEKALAHFYVDRATVPRAARPSTTIIQIYVSILMWLAVKAVHSNCGQVLSILPKSLAIELVCIYAPTCVHVEMDFVKLNHFKLSAFFFMLTSLLHSPKQNCIC